MNNTANPGKVVDCHPNIPDVARRDAFAGFAGMVQFTATLPAPDNTVGTGCLGGPARG